MVTYTLIARFMGSTCGPSGADRTKVGPMSYVIWDSLLSHTYIILGLYDFIWRQMWRWFYSKKKLVCPDIEIWYLENFIWIEFRISPFLRKFVAGWHSLSVVAFIRSWHHENPTLSDNYDHTPYPMRCHSKRVSKGITIKWHGAFHGSNNNGDSVQQTDCNRSICSVLSCHLYSYFCSFVHDQLHYMISLSVTILVNN